ncbi:hypothetical protein [Mesorhizobium sp. B2-5-11]|uniref:hypothetical protein n=1 Tax=Mesorhizobium sp. B2-5-11 TaxID=2589919 RepID=UPI00112696FE|nr:hypothetical protein [Mesorhizobium sp. B2-5-11]TPK14128.1 hypothetical protein FJ490_02055 [Mesorhizobium sp. B2-5-11]
MDEITITIRRDKAESMSTGLADLLCWCRGFRAALGSDEHEREPFGDWAAREMNITLKDALARAEKA